MERTFISADDRTPLANMSRPALTLKAMQLLVLLRTK